LVKRSTTLGATSSTVPIKPGDLVGGPLEARRKAISVSQRYTQPKASSAFGASPHRRAVQQHSSAMQEQRAAIASTRTEAVRAPVMLATASVSVMVSPIGRTSRDAVSPTTIESGSKAAAKKDRDRTEAEHKGVTVDELLQRRREEAAANLRLHEAALILGISTKALRARSQGPV
jgi:hypothetical protein